MSTPGNGISGVRGDVLIGTVQVSEVKKWSWNPKILTKDYCSNKTGGTKKRITSVKDGSGKIDGVWDPWDPITDHLDVGTEVTLKLYHTSTPAAQFWLVPAIIDDLSFDVDIDTGDVEAWSASYSVTGPWTKPAALPSTTTTTSAFMPAFEAAGALSDAPQVRQGGPAVRPAAQPAAGPWHQPQTAHAGNPADGPPAPGLSAGQMHEIAVEVARILAGHGFAQNRPNQAV